MVNKVYKFIKSGSGGSVMLPKKRRMVSGMGLLMKQEIKKDNYTPPSEKISSIQNKLENMQLGNGFQPKKKTYINFKF